ncbi:uncharacterized protein BYT42DRAFT_143818 [Radiomyces spectabilis]|uniref:uncharacterized protein n=1 Tax=Radiomyces spectabilis TaxID=64574 RepID=UPI00221FA64D|nr:uncharacterized protein BYT42DRAFT_143818 [Radiomyces spectabilis]KAI8366813.1 hypothetical protein BYT42DRAFT_143818 [Radiomyces spectabilis]
MSTTTNPVSTIIATEEASTTLLHRLHTNERALRTLAVVLSLAGGLVLSFTLGVGIFVYWYFRKYKRRRHSVIDEKPSKSMTVSNTTTYAPHNEDSVDKDITRQSTTLDNPTRPLSIRKVLPASLPPLPMPQESGAEPSAPSAKELCMGVPSSSSPYDIPLSTTQQHHHHHLHQHNSNVPFLATSSNQPPPSCHRCHHNVLEPPPPAYTPKPPCDQSHINTVS